MLGKKEDEDEESENLDLDGIDPEEAVHKKQVDTDNSENPGMQMLRQNTALLKLSALLDNSGGSLQLLGTNS